MKKKLRIAALLGVVCSASALNAQPARADWFSCEPENVYEWIGSHLSVKCSNTIALGGDQVKWIAVSTAADYADRFMRQAQAALLSGKIFLVEIPQSSTSNVPGCDAASCRTPNSFGLQEP